MVWDDSAGDPLVKRIILPQDDGAGSPAPPIAGMPAERDCPEIERVAEALKRYLFGEDVKLELAWADLSGLTDFQRDVLEAAHAIPRGTVLSYSALADAVGHVGAARAVGNAMAGNPVPLIVPCHRVIRADGSLGGFGGCSGTKEALLRLEGWDVESGQLWMS